ncbi:MAG: hypothetical protein HRT98_02685 [Mycoplasmatales bacterium]|nr:hypothetical protein [Mycoplasmatales bacterium]
MSTLEIVYIAVAVVLWIVLIWIISNIVINKREIKRLREEMDVLKKNNNSLWKSTNNLQREKLVLIERQKELDALNEKMK